jgi:hypothetical protein
MRRAQSAEPSVKGKGTMLGKMIGVELNVDEIFANETKILRQQN